MKNYIFYFNNYKIFVLDDHTISSNFIGYNDFGKEIFDTERTELGEKLYQLKYNSNKYGLVDIVNEVCNILNYNNLKNIDFVVPAPYTKPRTVQPVIEISKLVAERLKCQWVNVLTKNSMIEAKNKDICAVSDKNIECIPNSVHGSILLIDDLYSTGNTVKQCITKLINSNNNISEIHTVCITKTK